MPSQGSDKKFVADVFGRLDIDVIDLVKELDIHTPFDLPEPPANSQRSEPPTVQIPRSLLQ